MTLSFCLLPCLQLSLSLHFFWMKRHDSLLYNVSKQMRILPSLQYMADMVNVHFIFSVIFELLLWLSTSHDRIKTAKCRTMSWHDASESCLELKVGPLFTRSGLCLCDSVNNIPEGGREGGYLFSMVIDFASATFPSVFGKMFQRETTFDYVNSTASDNSKHSQKQLVLLLASCVPSGLCHRTLNPED